MTSTRTCARALALTGLVLAASACDVDPKNPPPKFRLEGSLTQVMDLGYDEARILVAPTDVSLLFVRQKPLSGDQPDGGVSMTGFSEEYPLKVAYRFLEEGLPAGGRVDLASLDMNGDTRGVASRNVTNDPRSVLPRIIRGTMSFDAPLDANTTVTGDFHLTFENGVEAASGRTAFSKYSAVVQP